jgi:hypothetical protein
MTDLVLLAAFVRTGVASPPVVVAASREHY